MRVDADREGYEVLKTEEGHAAVLLQCALARILVAM